MAFVQFANYQGRNKRLKRQGNFTERLIYTTERIKKEPECSTWEMEITTSRETKTKNGCQTPKPFARQLTNQNLTSCPLKKKQSFKTQ